MGYAEPKYDTKSFDSHDFGAGSGTQVFRGPKGYKGRLVGIEVPATETFTNTTTPAYVRVGTSGDNDAYAQLDLGVTAAGATASEATDTDAIISDALPADTDIVVNFVAPTGGSPAGIGQVHIRIEWWK